MSAHDGGGRASSPGPDGPDAPGSRAQRSPARRRLLLVLAVLALAVAAVLTYAQLSRTAPGEPTPAPAEPPATAADPSSGQVSAFPAPGTAVVHPQAQLSFRGLPSADLGEIAVVGSESGEHTGTLLPHSDGEGVSFLPDEPFVEGEDVTVTTEHPVRGGQDGEYTLTVAELGERPDLTAPPVQEIRGKPADPEGELAVEYVRHYPSAPGVEPPQVDVTGPEAGTVGPDDPRSPGLTAIGVKNGYGQKGPMLVDDAGEPVWFLPLDGVDARDVQVQEYRGEPVITWWEGLMGTGYGYGEAVVMDASYRELARVDMAGGYAADSHEVRITEDDTVLLIGYEPVRMDLTHVGGPADGQVIDNVVQEIDPATGALLFEWHSVGQVALEESYLPIEDAGDRYDYFHANSVEVDDDGDLLVSARHTCAAYSLDRETAAVEWRLGGRESDFAMGEGAFFIKQHDARRSADGTLTLLDNGGDCGDITREVTRGIALELDEEAMTAELTREYLHPEGLFSQSQANFQELPGGDVFFGWGSVARFTLMDQEGQVLLDGTIPSDLIVTSYRAHRVDWEGRPSTEPSAVAVDGAVHVSWNGATEVAGWRVLDDVGNEVGAAARDGFETVLPVTGAPEGLRVQALDAAGEVLGEGDVRTG
ncbi:arylsulfotransferase family protein [Georgenia phoenicis]|uniref:arylsulfotransferase family protein n=1 Tax=unclassified Georgenia TaxID=2626815 RepID=UPI0039AF80AD